MKIFAVRIGDKYGPEYETYLEKKLSDYEMVWIREPYHSDVQLQWNKMYAMNTGIDEPVCVIDIDMLLINDYKKILHVVSDSKYSGIKCNFFFYNHKNLHNSR